MKYIPKRDKMMYILMLQTLQQILQSDLVRDQVNQCVHIEFIRENPWSYIVNL